MSNTNGHILLTTRAPNAGNIARRIKMYVINKEDGTRFLLRKTGIFALDASLDKLEKEQRTQAEAIVNELAGLPLALEQAGAYIRETQISLSDYLKLYEMQHKKLLSLPSPDVDYPETVSTTWSISFGKIRRGNPAAVDLLNFCAFLNPDVIPEEIIVNGASEFAIC